MPLTDKQKHDLLIGGGIVGGGLLLLIMTHQPSKPTGHNGPQSQPKQRTTYAPNPAQATLDEQIVQARAALLTAADQDKLGAYGAQQQTSQVFNTNETNKEVAFNTNATQLKQTQLETTVAEAIAQAEDSAEEQLGNDQLQAQQAQQSAQSSQGIFGSIFGFLGSIVPFLAAGA